MIDIFKDLTVLVVGYDKYVDVWDHFFTLMNKNWKERPATYLACSTENPNYENVKVICAGEGSEWSKKVQVALSQIKTKYILLLLEDFFIERPIDNNVVQEALERIDTNNIKFSQMMIQTLHPKHVEGKKFLNMKEIRIVPSDKKYALNLQPAIWEREYLIKAVGEENYNTWEFEMRNISIPDLNTKEIECIIDARNIFNILHMIVQSKYLPGAVKKLKKLGYDVQDGKRAELSKKEAFKYNTKLLMYEITPKPLVKFAKKIGKLFKFDFVVDRLSKKKEG